MGDMAIAGMVVGVVGIVGLVVLGVLAICYGRTFAGKASNQGVDVMTGLGQPSMPAKN